MQNLRKLTEIINVDHESVKYLPEYRLLENIAAWSFSMGAIVADEIAAVEFYELTIGLVNGALIQQLLNCSLFWVNIAIDFYGVELCWTLKILLPLVLILVIQKLLLFLYDKLN